MMLRGAIAATLMAAALCAPAGAVGSGQVVFDSRQLYLGKAVTLVDLRTRKDAGGVIEVVQDAYLTKGVEADSEVRWVQSLAEYDCAGHRVRTKTLAMLNLDRSKRTEKDEAFGEWQRVASGSVNGRLEALVCRGTRDVYLLDVPDLKTFVAAHLVVVGKARRPAARVEPASNAP
jgi:hypothetical protein